MSDITAEITIDQLASLGDGAGKLDGQTVYIPATLPGERVKASGQAPRLTLTGIITPSPHRITPICKHFGVCGGCSLQHLAGAEVLKWKRAEVTSAFSRAGIETKIAPCIASPAFSRRRVTFTVRRENGEVRLGFHKRESQDLVQLEQCPILLPEIEAELPALRQLAATLLRGNEDIQIAINLCDNGFDLDFQLLQPPSEDMLAGFVRAFARTPFLRASVNGEVMVEKEKPLVSFNGVMTQVPPGGFLQAVGHAEQAMADLVCDYLKPAKSILDLYSGSGTFTLRLARNSRVHAVENQAPALVALASASSAEGLKPVTTEQRDLEELPLTARELKPFDAICIDPPRAGAAPQIREIAKSTIRRLAYVSCNPVTLARDAKTLVDTGWKLERVVPVDQFVFSHHIEVVALFSRKPDKKSRSIFR